MLRCLALIAGFWSVVYIRARGTLGTGPPPRGVGVRGLASTAFIWKGVSVAGAVVTLAYISDGHFLCSLALPTSPTCPLATEVLVFSDIFICLPPTKCNFCKAGTHTFVFVLLSRSEICRKH